MPTIEASFPHLQALDRQVEAIAGATSPVEVFQQIHRACRWAVPRAAVFLVRRGEVCGWSSTGYGPEVAEALRAHRSPLDAAWRDLTRVPDFGQPAFDEARLLALEVKDQPIAFVLVERATGQGPWFPEALNLLAAAARLRLELDLAQRKLGSTSRAPVVAPPAEPAAASAKAPASAASSETDDLRRTELDPEPSEIDVREPVDSPEILAARRYARLVATDIRLYHEDAVLLGQRNGDLVQRLGNQLDLGKQTFLRRYGSLGPAALELLREAYVQVLAAGKAELIPSSALD